MLFVTYDVLKGRVNQAIVSLVKSHDSAETINEDKIRDFTYAIPNTDKRRTQAEFLLQVIDLVNKIEPADGQKFSEAETRNRSLILNGAAYYIYIKIAQSYNTYTSLLTLSTPSGSALYNSLETALGLTQENQFSNSETVEMFNALKQFIASKTYVQWDDPSKGYLDESQRGFTSANVTDIKVEKMLDDLRSRIFDLETATAAEAKKIDKEAKRPKASSLLGFGFLTSRGPRAKKESEELDDNADAKISNSLTGMSASGSK